MAAKQCEHEFVEVVPEELTCPICMKVLCEPHLTNCCAQQFCKNCLEKWLVKNKACPHCRSTGFSHMFMRRTEEKVGELKVYCPNKQHGCTGTLKLVEREEHLSPTNDGGCLYIKLECPNRCLAEIFHGEMGDEAMYSYNNKSFWQLVPLCDIHTNWKYGSVFIIMKLMMGIYSARC